LSPATYTRPAPSASSRVSARSPPNSSLIFRFFNGHATPETYSLSLHDALPIYFGITIKPDISIDRILRLTQQAESAGFSYAWMRSEEHTSELQSHLNLVCRLLLEKKKRAKATKGSKRQSRCSTR